VFRGVVISGVVKMIKPEPGIFEHIARQYALAPAETLFIDDMKPNIETARRMGFQTLWFETPERCGAEVKRLLAL
jgi:HAD superfamily hydrolase (TIGR01509 family)